jgi:soluble lytic murein transglycosylase
MSRGSRPVATPGDVRLGLLRVLAAVPVLLLASSLEPAVVPPSPPVDPPPAAARVLPAVTPAYQAAAVAVRNRNFIGALQALEQLSERDDDAGRHARVVAGLYAHSLELPEAAVRLLGEEPTSPGPLEDWRLWVLADSRAATGDPALGLACLERLLADWPDSPLVPRALVRAVELARDAGKGERAVALVDLGRRRNLPADHAEELERLAWQIGLGSGRGDVAASAAVRLLTDYPLAANELGVPDRYPVSRLTPAQLQRRAEALLSRRLPTDAQAVLLGVPAEARGLDWHLLMARALTISGRGAEAAKLLAPVASKADLDAARLAWARAQAALDQAEVRRGGKGAAAARERALRQGLSYLDESARLAEGEAPGSDLARDLAIRALHQLFAEHASRERVDPALAALRRLHRLAPEDPVGVPFLWGRGWREYRTRNYTGAIGYWSELVAQAPRERYPRGARYWSARAFEALGDRSRAEALYTELAAADTTDFYRRHAVARLGSAAHHVTYSMTTPEPWPSDRRLLRARYLSDVGLDGLAATELELAGSGAEPRARAALQGIVLARQGRPRPSMDHLRSAFPALGTPLQASVPGAALELYYPLHYREVVEHWAAARALPVPLVLAVVRQESAFDLTATSRSGARGLMQLMPGTARDVAVKVGVPYSSERLYDPEYSLQLGTSYLAHVLELFDGDVELALAGYNSGPYRLLRLWREDRRGEVDAFIENLQLEEPKAYVKRILLLSDSYSRLYPELAG